MSEGMGAPHFNDPKPSVPLDDLTLVGLRRRVETLQRGGDQLFSDDLAAALTEIDMLRERVAELERQALLAVASTTVEDPSMLAFI